MRYYSTKINLAQEGENIRELYLSGFSSPEIAQQYNLHPRTICRYLPKLGVTLSNHKQAAERHFLREGTKSKRLSNEQIKDLYLLSQMSAYDIAQRLGVSDTMIYKVLKRLGLTRTGSQAVQVAVERGKRGRSDIKNESIVHLYVDQQKTTPEIAKILNCSLTLIHNRLERLLLNEGISVGVKRAIKNQRLLVRQGENHPSWKGGRLDHGGYVLIWQAPKKYKGEHVLVWEEYHHQSLPEGWIVHHLNGVKNDNRIENLIGLPSQKHALVLKEKEKRIRDLEQECSILGERSGPESQR